MTLRPPDWLDSQAITTAFLWKLTRQDGVVLGFTSHDRTIHRAGLQFDARPGMTPSAISIEEGFDIDTLSISGALTADGLRGDDLELGRWDGAHVELAICDWRSPDDRWMRLASGTIGDVVRQDHDGAGSFSVELLSPIAALSRGGPPRCSALCRASLGDARCQVDMSEHRIEAAVDRVEEAALILADPLPAPERFSDGVVRFLTGPFAGIDRPIGVAEEDRVELLDPLPGFHIGRCRVRLSEGCDRRFETCATRFGNAAQFDGEPHVPGTDALLRYDNG